MFSEGDGTVAITGYDGGYDGSPAGLLGCLPRCLYSLWVMNGMTQHQMKINGPDSDILARRTMDDRGRVTCFSYVVQPPGRIFWL